LLVARGDSTPESKRQLASSKLLTKDQTSLSGTEDQKSVRSRMDLENEALFFRHLNALFRKRALNFQRDKKAWCCTTILPIIATTLGFIIFLVTSPNRDLSPVTLELSLFNPDVTTPPINPIVVNSPNNPYTCQPGTCSYYPIVAQNETSEIYAYCGTQANLGVSASDGEINVGKYQCSIDLSTDILRELDGFQGAVSIETGTETVLDVSFFLVLNVYYEFCAKEPVAYVVFIVFSFVFLFSHQKVSMIRRICTLRLNMVLFGTHGKRQAL
jgi:hypothetical protein